MPLGSRFVMLCLACTVAALDVLIGCASDSPTADTNATQTGDATSAQVGELETIRWELVGFTEWVAQALDWLQGEQAIHELLMTSRDQNLELFLAAEQEAKAKLGTLAEVVESRQSVLMFQHTILYGQEAIESYARKEIFYYLMIRADTEQKRSSIACWDGYTDLYVEDAERLHGLIEGLETQTAFVEAMTLRLKTRGASTHVDTLHVDRTISKSQALMESATPLRFDSQLWVLDVGDPALVQPTDDSSSLCFTVESIRPEDLGQTLRALASEL